MVEMCQSNQECCYYSDDSRSTNIFLDHSLKISYKTKRNFCIHNYSWMKSLQIYQRVLFNSKLRNIKIGFTNVLFKIKDIRNSNLKQSGGLF